MNVRQIVDRVDTLPTLPDVVIQLNQFLKDSSIDIESIANIIEKDAALSSKVLLLANSSYYGLSSKVDSIFRSIIVLGFNTVCKVIMTASVYQMFNTQSKRSGVDFGGMWLHTLGCAVASKVVMAKNNEMESEKAFMCGILHDIGKVAISGALPLEQEKILTLQKDSGMPLVDAEREVLGTDHAEVGYGISKKWNFPDYMCEVIRCHHQPSVSKTAALFASAVHIGNSIAKALALGKSTEPRVTTIDLNAWALLDIAESDIFPIVDTVQNEFDLAMDCWTPE